MSRTRAAVFFSSQVLSIVLLVQGALIHSQTVSNGSIRLFHNGTNSSLPLTSGRVQLFYNGQWGNICSKGGFGIAEASVVCHQLGYRGAIGYSNGSNDGFGEDTSSAVLHNVNCASNQYLVILQCSHSPVAPAGGCTHDQDVSVYCSGVRIWDSPYDGQVRLTGGTTVNQGLVEVYYNGQWGSVCDDGFGQNESNTICRQLGYTNANLSRTRIGMATANQSLRLTCPSTQSCVRHCQQQWSSLDDSNNSGIFIECFSDSNTEIPNNVNQNSTCRSNTLPNIPRSSLLIAIVGGSLGGSIILLGLAIAIVYSYWKGKLRISKTTPSHVRRDASWFNFQVTNQLAVSPTYAPDKNKTFKNFPHPGSPTMQAVPVS